MTKTYYNDSFLILGIAGALILLLGYTQVYPQPYYIIGSCALLITAIHCKLVYFIALELILAAGHTAILLDFSSNVQLALPVLLCFQLLVFYLMVGRENTIFLLIGIVGIALLSVGFAYKNQWIFFSGSSAIAAYAYYDGFKGRYPSYIWGGLNTVFSILALYKILI